MQRSLSRTGMPALVGLLLVVFAIAGLLVYEAWSTGQSRREIAERGLQDYAAYASWSTARAGESMLAASLSTIFRDVTGDRVEDGDDIAPVSTVAAGAKYLEQCNCAMNIPADYFFRYDRSDEDLETAIIERSTPQTVETSWAAAKVGSYTPQSDPVVLKPDESWLKQVLGNARLESLPNFALQLASHGDSILVIGLAPQRDSSGKIVGALGFVTLAHRFANATFAQLWRNPEILPIAITRGMPNESLLAARVTTPGGVEIYKSKGWIDGLRSDTASLGLFGGGMKIRVALRPDATVRLQGGVVPASRVPVWVGLLLLTGLLTVIIVRNLQREHELARLRLEFSASVSHELRTPLAQILLFGETLTLGRTRSDTERRDAANVIVREARRLMHLVDNTLTFSRAERPVVSLSPRRQPLAPLVKEVIAGFIPLASAKDVRITHSLDDRVEGFVDGEAFRQVLLNLLDNAVKYGPPAGRVSVGLTRGHTRLAVEPAQRQKHVVRRSTIRLTVDDEGPGVSGRARDEIWVPFARGMNGEPPVGTGCGLGLAVVRELAERHNGYAWVEGTPGGQGSRFVIELPDAAVDWDQNAKHNLRVPAAEGAGAA
ncbi:MAG TPA: HAMP domain-containing sensor histidine kinase [Gemmatimonadaceae bacterium]